MYDPFAGTGSILVAAAQMGAITLGADIDAKVIRDGRQVNITLRLTVLLWVAWLAQQAAKPLWYSHTAMRLVIICMQGQLCLELPSSAGAAGR